jgi:Avidin family
MKRLFAALLLVVATSVSAFAESLPVPSYWLNQRGSEMKLYAIDGDHFHGVFINHAAGFACQYTPYELAGRTSGRHVAFAVVWKNWAQDCRSKSVWHGRLVGHTIWTRWKLFIHHDSGAISVVRGRDNFQLQP